jgi:hypothetical protein
METVGQEVKSLEHFLALLLDQEDLILNNKFSSLSRSWEKQKEALSLAKSLERRRLLITDRLSEKFKVDKYKFNLCLLSDLLEESYSAKIEELQRVLFDLYRKVENQKEKNQRLIRESSGFLTPGEKANHNSLILIPVKAKANLSRKKTSSDSLSDKIATK